LLGSFTLSNPNIDETVLRTVGSISVNTDQIVATENQIGAFGMIVISNAANAIGVTAVPGPITDIEDDGWFVYVPITQHFQFGDGTGFAFTTPLAFNSKAKRITEEGERIALVVENATVHGFNFSMVMRMLSMVRGTG